MPSKDPAKALARSRRYRERNADGYWTHPAGKDPLDWFSQRITLDVYTTPPDQTARIALLEGLLRALEGK